MSTYPRRVTASITVTWGGETFFARAGTFVDIKPGSLLEQAYGAGNLTPVIAMSAIGGDGSTYSKEALSN